MTMTFEKAVFLALVVFLTSDLLCALSTSKCGSEFRHGTSEWLLCHCAKGTQSSDTVCFTEQDDPVPCQPVENIQSCDKAAKSFSHVPGPKTTNLSHESLAKDENLEFLCYFSDVDPNDRVDTFIGSYIEIEEKYPDESMNSAPLTKFGCSYPKGIRTSVDLKKTMCCRRMPRDFFTAGTRFSTTIHHWPPQLSSPRAFREFKVDQLPTISLKNYTMNYVNSDQDNIHLPSPKNDAGQEDGSWLMALIVGGVLLFIAIVIAFGLFRCLKRRQSSENVLEGEGTGEDTTCRAASAQCVMKTISPAGESFYSSQNGVSKV